jgi:GT2 family glycosyltransferase
MINPNCVCGLEIKHTNAGRRCGRCGRDLTVELTILRKKMKNSGKVKKKITDIIIPTYENDSLTAQCIKSIIDCTEKGTYRIIWVDNGSKRVDKTLKAIKDINSIYVFLQENTGFVGAVNEGLRLSNADTVCLLNNDTVLTPGWLGKLLNQLENNPKLGIVGPLTGYGWGGNYENVDSQHSVSLHREILPKESVEWCIEDINEYLENHYLGRTTPASFVAFLCAVIKREVIDAVGYLDTNYEMGLWDDVDWNISAKKAGYDVALSIDTCIDHKGRQTFNIVEKEGVNIGEILHDNKMYLDAKWAVR